MAFHGGDDYRMVVASAAVFLVSLLLGAVGIYVGALIVVGANDFDHAVVTALLGSIVWAIVGAVLGWVPLLGPLLALVAYVGVINWRYGTDWTAAAMIGLVGWLTVFAVLYGLAAVGLAEFDAIGVPSI